MNRKFKVSIAKTVFDRVMGYGVSSPVEINNACELLGIGKTPLRKNHMMMYFMTKANLDVYDRDAKPTEVEQQQIDYILANLNTNLEVYLKTIDSVESASMIGSAADTDIEQSHSEVTDAEVQQVLDARTIVDEAKIWTTEEKIAQIETELETCVDSNEKRSLKMRLNNLKKKLK